MGQIASNGFSNLAYWSRAERVTAPIAQPADPPAVAFDADRTYVSFVVGDGDNLNFIKARPPLGMCNAFTTDEDLPSFHNRRGLTGDDITTTAASTSLGKGSRQAWMKQRVAACAARDGGACAYPLVWTLSPHLLYAAPDMLAWYVAQAKATGADYFVLPPSGHLYAYPSLLDDDAQVSARSRAACARNNDGCEARARRAAGGTGTNRRTEGRGDDDANAVRDRRSSEAARGNISPLERPSLEGSPSNEWRRIATAPRPRQAAFVGIWVRRHRAATHRAPRV